jgi:hypothetical protein
LFLLPFSAQQPVSPARDYPLCEATSSRFGLPSEPKKPARQQVEASRWPCPTESICYYSTRYRHVSDKGAGSKFDRAEKQPKDERKKAIHMHALAPHGPLSTCRATPSLSNFKYYTRQPTNTPMNTVAGLQQIRTMTG